jgi:hypothetical protein
VALSILVILLVRVVPSLTSLAVTNAGAFFTYVEWFDRVSEASEFILMLGSIFFFYSILLIFGT